MSRSRRRLPPSARSPIFDTRPYALAPVAQAGFPRGSRDCRLSWRRGPAKHCRFFSPASPTSAAGATIRRRPGGGRRQVNRGSPPRRPQHRGLEGSQSCWLTPAGSVAAVVISHGGLTTQADIPSTYALGPRCSGRRERRRHAVATANAMHPIWPHLVGFPHSSPFARQRSALRLRGKSTSQPQRRGELARASTTTPALSDHRRHEHLEHIELHLTGPSQKSASGQHQGYQRRLEVVTHWAHGHSRTDHPAAGYAATNRRSASHPGPLRHPPG